MITLSGICDEAAVDIDGQIQAHKELQWDCLELRLVNGKNICSELSDQEFDNVVEKVSLSGMTVTAFASAIGNWSREISDDFEEDLQELKTSVVRMKRFGVKYIRTMSWVQGDASEEYWHEETIKRYKVLAEIAQAHDICLAHENCTGWGGQTARHMLRLIEETGSDNVKLLFDIGNTVAYANDPLEFYTAIRDHIAYVHVKDCFKQMKDGKRQYTYPGQGDAMVKEILTDLIASGYNGVISIEPHVANAIHLQEQKTPSRDTLYDSYIGYGRTLQDIVNTIVIK